jgi:hypothetical protein
MSRINKNFLAILFSLGILLLLPVIALAADGSGAATCRAGDEDPVPGHITDAVVGAGSTNNVLEIVYTIAETMTPGAIKITWPADWTPPSRAAGPGLIDVVAGGGAALEPNVGNDDGTLDANEAYDIFGQVLQIGIATGPVGDTITVTYGDGGGANTATAPTVAGVNIPITTASDVEQDGTYVNLTSANQPKVTILGDGSGAAERTAGGPVDRGAAADAPIVFTFTAACTMTGDLTFTVPDEWSYPIQGTGAADGAGATLVAVGAAPNDGAIGAITFNVAPDPPTVSIEVDSLQKDDTIIITYGDDDAGANPGDRAATTNDATSPATFLFETRTEDNSTLNYINNNPNVGLNGSGTIASSVTSVVAGSTNNTIQFTYVATETMGDVLDGQIALTVPLGWSPPRLADDQPGHTTVSSTGTITQPPVFGGNTVTVTVEDLAANQTVIFTYGDEEPAQAGTSNGQFTVRSWVDQSAGGLVNLSDLDPINIELDGSGTASVSPPQVNASQEDRTITVEYTVTQALQVGGAISVDIPNGWTAPQNNTTGSPGYTTAKISVNAGGGAGIGTPSINNREVEVPITGTPGDTLNPGSKIQVVYGDVALGGSGSGAVVQPTREDDVEFTVSSKIGTGQLANLAVGSPTLDVLFAQSGTGTAIVSPNSGVLKGTLENTLEFTYTAIGEMNGKIEIDIPAGDGWEVPTLAVPANVALGAATTATIDATLAVAGNTITVDIDGGGGDPNTMLQGNIIVVEYGTTDNEVLSGIQDTSDFPVRSEGTEAGGLVAITQSPLEVSLVDIPDGSGQADVNPENAVSLSTNNTFAFTLTAGGFMAAQTSIFTIEVPAGWSEPQVALNTDPGFVVATDAGTIQSADVTVTSPAGDNTITIELNAGVDMLENDDIVVEYGSDAGSGGGATVPDRTGDELFTVSTRIKTEAQGGTLTALTAGSPSVFLTTPDGSGEIQQITVNGVVDDPVNAGSNGNEIIFQYRAATTLGDPGLGEGKVTFTFPPGWTAPQGTDNQPGYTTVVEGAGVDLGTLEFDTANRTVAVPIIEMNNSNIFDLHYGDSDAAFPDLDDGATVQGNAGEVTIIVQSQAGPDDPDPHLKTLAANALPIVTVINAAAGSGSIEVDTTPDAIVENTPGNILTFTYTAIGTMDGLLEIDIDGNWWRRIRRRFVDRCCTRTGL